MLRVKTSRAGYISLGLLGAFLVPVAFVSSVIGFANNNFGLLIVGVILIIAAIVSFYVANRMKPKTITRWI